MTIYEYVCKFTSIKGEDYGFSVWAQGWERAEELAKIHHPNGRVVGKKVGEQNASDELVRKVKEMRDGER